MSGMINHFTVMGHLTADPELQTTKGGVTLCNFSIAVPRPKFKDKDSETDFFNVTAWRSLAVYIAKHFKKGKIILLEGALRNNFYLDEAGIKRYAYEIQAEQAYFADYRAKESADNCKISEED